MSITLDTSEFSAGANKLIARFNELRASLTDDEGRHIVKTLTDKLEAESVKRAPIDEGNLQHSHQKALVKEAEGGGFGSYRWAGYVFIPANSPAADYALAMHEGEYKLGEVSRQKQAGQPEVVGRKFLERALHENMTKWQAYVVRRLMAFFKRQT